MTNLFSIDTNDVDRLQKDLELFNKRAMPYATRSTMTGAAFKARTNWQEQINQNLVTRNKYTERSVRVDKARTLKIANQQAVVGSIADYMETTEEGGTESGTSGNKAIPTGYSAGQQGQRPRTRLPRRKNRMPNITIAKGLDRSQWASKAQEIYVKILMAAREGHRFVFLETSTTRGIYELKGKPRETRGKLTGVRMRMVQNLSKRSVRIPATPTLEPALAETVPEITGIYRDALLFQLKRNKILGYR